MNPQLSVVYFPAALLLGALHALEPGHAKVLTASYLIGIKGTKRDSIILGLSVATTHSVVVILISAIGLWLGNEAFTGKATVWLERASGLVAIAIGVWMLWRRLSRRFKQGLAHHHHEAVTIPVRMGDLSGNLDIIDTPIGERMRFRSDLTIADRQLTIEIWRDPVTEILNLEQSPDDPKVFLSGTPPDEPHEFSAQLIRQTGERFSFQVHEPADHHSHEHLDDIAHAQAHANNLPDYAKQGLRPKTSQIIAFGAAGGMIPCPASITVMLLAVAAGKTSLGLFTVLGFSLGLAITLVGIGMVIVTGLSHIQSSGRFVWVSKNAPILSAGLVTLSGIFALLISH